MPHLQILSNEKNSIRAVVCNKYTFKILYCSLKNKYRFRIRNNNDHQIIQFYMKLLHPIITINTFHNLVTVSIFELLEIGNKHSE